MPSISTRHACFRTFRANSFQARPWRWSGRQAGIRSVEIGSVMFGTQAQHEVLRLAIPHRVYTQSHIDYVVEAILEVNARKKELRGLRIVGEPPFLRHFSARFRPVEGGQA
jgi:tryptophanase